MSKKILQKKKTNQDRFQSEKAYKSQIAENEKPIDTPENEIAKHPKAQFQDATTQTSNDDARSKQNEILFVPPIDQEKNKYYVGGNVQTRVQP